jgi:hypothetical protein
MRTTRAWSGSCRSTRGTGYVTVSLPLRVIGVFRALR